MSSAYKNRVDPVDQTQIIDSAPESESKSSMNGHFIVVRRKRRLIKVFRPEGKNITFGRSSRCSLVLSDPRFPRKAGEIILGPVPILRRFGKDENSHEFLSLYPGKPCRIRPYKLTLMEPGDVIFHRFREKTHKLKLLDFRVLVIAVLGIGILFFFNQRGDVWKNVDQQRTDGPIEAVIQNNQKEVKNSTKEAKISKAMNIPRSASKGIFPTGLNPPVTEINLDTELKITDKIISVTETVTEKKERERNGKNIPIAQLKATLNSALSLVERGDLVMAGRTLKPLLEHAGDQGVEMIIKTLDPPVQAIFRKAYMLKLYEPERSREILKRIVDSKMDILPSYGKAKKMLEGKGAQQSGVAE